MKLTFALVGNQNCGKSTLFNYLTGSNQHVGNFPGVTVHKNEGILLKYKDITVIDLPGIYSLSPYTSEEIVTRDLLLRNKPDVIVNVLDAPIRYPISRHYVKCPVLLPHPHLVKCMYRFV